MISEPFEFSNEGALLQGTLTLPEGSPTCPAVVVAHGAQGGSRDFFLYRHLAHLLAGEGIATLRFDRRGEGTSTGVADAPFAQLGSDVAAGLHALADHPGVDPARLALWGISQGGWITILATTKGPPLAGLAIVSGTPVTPARQMTHAVTRILEARGYDEAVVERALGARTLVERYARGELVREAVEPVLGEARGEPWFQDAWIPTLDEADWGDMGLDVTPVMQGLRVPTLLFFGELDPWIPIEESIETWQAEAPSLDLTIELVPGVGHEMIAGDPLAMPTTGAPAHAYERTLVDWMNRVLRPKNS